MGSVPRRLDFLAQNTSSSAIEVERYINIDSRDRNRTTYPDTNDYIVYLKDALFGVRSVELVSAEIPKSEYFIDESNNLLELLIDPVLFASNSPGSGDSSIISEVIRGSKHLVARIDTSNRNSHGVLHYVDVETGDDAEFTFNASATALVQMARMSAGEFETILVVAYSEPGENSTGAARLAICDHRQDAVSISFGSEFQFDDGVAPVHDKALCPLDERLFALAYNYDDTELRLVVGSTGVDAADLDGRLSNSNLVRSACDAYAAARVDDSTVFVACCAGGQLFAQLILVDSAFAISSGHGVVIDAGASSRLSCDCANGRVVVASVHAGVLKVYVLSVVEGPTLVLRNASTYGSATSSSRINASGPGSFQVDSNAVVKWSSGVFRVVDLKLRRSATGNIISRGHETFPDLVLEDFEHHRIRIEPHASDPQLPQTELDKFHIYTSQTQNTLYDRVVRSGSGVVTLELNGSIQTLFYGTEGTAKRGVIAIREKGSFQAPFSVFASGAHEGGATVFGFRSTVLSEAARSVRRGFSNPGAAAGQAVGVSECGVFLAEDGELWMFARGRWALVRGTVFGSSSPGPRSGAAMAGRDGRLFLFGGLAAARGDGRSHHLPHLSAVPTQTGVRLRNFRNSATAPRIFQYSVALDAGEPLRFRSLSDPSDPGAPPGGGSWSNLHDVSLLFEKPTAGVHVSSFATASTTFRHGPGGGVNPTGGTYTFQVLVFPRLEPNDQSGQLAFAPERVELGVTVMDGQEKKATLALAFEPNAWSNCAVPLHTAGWASDSLENLSVVLAVAPVFMHHGVLAVREPELFVDDLRVDAALGAASALTVEAYSSGSELLVREVLPVPPPQLEESGELLLADLWSMRVDPFFGECEFVLRGAAAGGAVDRCLRAKPVASGRPIKAAFLACRPAAAVAAGEALYEDGEDGASMRFDGTSVVEVPGAALGLRSTKTGDFCVTATLKPRVCKMLLTLDHSSNGVLVSGRQPSDAQHPGSSALLPFVYLGGLSLAFSSGDFLRFDEAFPDLLAVNAHVLVPSNVTGRVPLFEFNRRQCYASGSSLHIEDMSIPFPRNEWFHLSILASGLATRLYVNDAPVDGLVSGGAGGAALQVGGSGWNGQVLLAGTSVCTMFKGGIDDIESVRERHRKGHVESNSYTVLSCGLGSRVGLSIDTSASRAVLRGSCLNVECEVPLEDGVVDVVFGRRDGSVVLRAGGHEDVRASGLSLSLLGGEVRVGGSAFFGDFDASTYCGEVDELRLLTGFFDDPGPAALPGAGAARERSMAWRRVAYSGAVDDPHPLTPRAHASMTLDADSNVWIFGGDQAAGVAGDLWQIDALGASPRGMHLSGPALVSTAADPQLPPARSRSASYGDGANIYVFGGETGAAVGPYELQGTLVGVSVIGGAAPPAEGDPAWSGAASGYVYPVFTNRHAVLLDSPGVAWLQVETAGGGTVTVFAYPSPSSPDDPAGYLSQEPSGHPPLPTSSGAAADAAPTPLGDTWRYEINAGRWERLHAGGGGAGGAGPSPAPRAACHVHYEGDSLYLLPGQSGGADPAPQDLWAFSLPSLAWTQVVRYSEGSAASYSAESSLQAFPGSSPSVYWRGEGGRPHLFRDGAVFVNEMQSASAVANLHLGVVINAFVRVDSSQAASVEFDNRAVFQDSSLLHPGALDVSPAPAMGDGAFFVATTSRIHFVRISPGSLAEYDPVVLPAAEVVAGVEGLSPGGVAHELIRGVSYEFRGLRPQDFSIGGVAETLDGAVVTASADFAVTAAAGVLTFVVRDFAAAAAASESMRLPFEEDSVRTLRGASSHALEDLLSPHVFSDVKISVGDDSSPAVARVQVAYVDRSNSRFGTGRTLVYESAAGVFAASGEASVLFASNPTAGLAVSPALFGRSVVAASTGAGLESLMTSGSGQSPRTLVSPVAVEGAELCLLNDMQFSPSSARWVVFFVFNGNLRVAAQRSVEDALNAPVQNLVGENIRYSRALALRRSAATGARVRVCRLSSGPLAGEVVVVHSDGGGGLFFKDALVSGCDPLVSDVPPAAATETFSLVSDVSLVSEDFYDFEVVSCASLAATNFLVFFTSADRRELRYRLYVWESGAYLTRRSEVLMSWSSPGSIARVSESAFEFSTYCVHVLREHEAVFVEVEVSADASDGLSSRVRVKTHFAQAFDIPFAAVSSASHVTDSSLVVFSVHESSTTQSCAITSRVLARTQEHAVGVSRRSFHARVTPGDYAEIGTFREEVQRQLLRVDKFFQTSFNEGTRKIQISNSHSPFRIILNKSAFDESSSNGLAYILGFRDFRDVVAEFAGDSFVVQSTKRIDMFGRQYLYLFLTSPHATISSETTSRNKENAFGRIVLSVNKGDTMFYTNSLYRISADVSIDVLSQLRVRLGRFAQLDSDLADGRDVSLYSPQGMEHSFSLKVTCALDKVRSSKMPAVPMSLLGGELESESESDDGDISFG